MISWIPPAARLLSRLRAAVICGALSLSLLGGCATTGNPRDPLEPLNRAVYTFNDGFDAILSSPRRSSIGSSFRSSRVPE